MLATLYTQVPLRSEVMRSGIHKTDPQGILARNLRAAFEARGLSARGVSRAIKSSQGLSISNKTISNMLNGDGNPQLEGLTAVAKHLRIPLWQLMCPAAQPSHLDDAAVHALLEDFVSLSELGRRRAQRNLKAEVTLEEMERSENHKNTGKNST